MRKKILIITLIISLFLIKPSISLAYGSMEDVREYEYENYVSQEEDTGYSSSKNNGAYFYVFTLFIILYIWYQTKK